MLPQSPFIEHGKDQYPDLARDAVDLVAATIDSLAGVVEHAIFGVELLNGRAPARGVVLTEDFLKIAGQQSRYAVGHGLSPLGTWCRLRFVCSYWRFRLS